MRVQIKRIREKTDECTTIECVEITPDIESIRTYALSKGTVLSGMVDDRTYQFNLSEVIYFEAVDEKVFANTHHMVRVSKAKPQRNVRPGQICCNMIK